TPVGGALQRNRSGNRPSLRRQSHSTSTRLFESGGPMFVAASWPCETVICGDPCTRIVPPEQASLFSSMTWSDERIDVRTTRGDGTGGDGGVTGCAMSCPQRKMFWPSW